ncbi:MerR family DNA-binding transcriptional regulator [Variovorax sp. LjRoot290]|uniref:MerR family transcriptional regulator n=1 Tax=Variovorax sp. LjRoot290 TaxID=3342316 RepID=UPI003ECFD7BF
MRISELAQRAGVTVHALRHYERLGLLLPARTDSDYRDYPESMRREVVFIAMARRIGFSLPAIAELLPAYRAGRLSITRMTDALEERVAALDAQIAELQALRAQVIEHAAWLRAQRRKPPAAAKKKAPWPRTSTTSSSKDKR